MSRFNIIVRSFSGYCLSRNVERRIHDFASRPARGFGDGEEFSMGSRRMKWLYTPHVPHGWDCGVLFDLSTETLRAGTCSHNLARTCRP